VDIGGALAEARSEAGMTITQVSERTRIRETIIRGIEQDDYSACGGDFYARGHIRAIARVVGTDPVPLIEEYDTVHTPPPDPAMLQSADQRDRHGSDDNRANGGGAAALRGITAAEAFRPAMPLRISGGHRPRRTGMLALIVLALIGIVTYLLVSGSSSANTTAPPRPDHSARVGGTTRGAAKHGAAKHGAAKHGAAKHGTGAHGSATPSPAASAVTAPAPLVPASAAAFGPDGASQGDNPQLAPLAIDSSDNTAWQTDWYATANFSGLQAGTGLLLDMGRTVSFASARILLGLAAGGALQLRAGNSAVLADMPVVAQSANTGGSVTLQVRSPVLARYLLVWFTGLPPDASGTYQASIYNVSIAGTS
jgi:hypothetical protein